MKEVQWCLCNVILERGIDPSYAKIICRSVDRKFTMDVNELSGLFKQSLTDDDICMISTTVDTGFEREAADECQEKLHGDIRVVRERGKIYFNIHRDQFAQVQQMRSIDNIFIVADVQTLSFGQTDKEADLELFSVAVHKNMDLNKALDTWKHVTNFMGKLYPTEEECTTAKEQMTATKTETSQINKGKKRGQDPSKSKENDILRYRVTCERTGKHTFESGDVARAVGGELQNKYHWVVDLSTYHLEILCKLIESELILYLRVTHESKHHRNIMYFGPTTLRSTICYNLLRLAYPKPGDVIIDPMCGGGSIPIEAVLAYSCTYVLCGDKHPKAMDRAKSNIGASTAQHKIDLLQWSASKLPFKDSFIDIVVTDMPFGKRSGSTMDNSKLYKSFLLELGRVVKLSSGRLILLTYDRHSFYPALQTAGDLFWTTRTVGVNVGGLHAVVYVLKRTNVSHENFKPRIRRNIRNVTNITAASPDVTTS